MGSGTDRDQWGIGSCKMPSFPCKEGSVSEDGEVREFETGATRDTDQGKRDYEGFLSPMVVHRFGEYMHQHRIQSDGSLRDSDNWQQGIPLSSYMKSMWRHFLDLWLYHRGFRDMAREGLEEALCAILFNVQGYLHEVLKERRIQEAVEHVHSGPTVDEGLIEERIEEELSDGE